MVGISKPKIATVMETTVRLLLRRNFVILCYALTLIGSSCGQTNLPGQCTPKNPCQNGGDCSVISTSPDYYSCACAQWFSGSNCEYDDRDTQVRIEFPSYSAIEHENVDIYFIRSGELERTTTIEIKTFLASGDYALSGGDFVPVQTTLDFPPGADELSVGISLVDDPIVEGDETFSVSLAVIAGGVLEGTGVGVATVTIFDDDGEPPTFSSSSSMSSLSLSSSSALSTLGLTGVTLGTDSTEVVEVEGVLEIEISRTGNLDVTTTVYLSTMEGSAKEPADFMGLAESITFDPFEETHIVELDIVDDNNREMNREDLRVLLEIEAGADVVFPYDEMRVVIIDDDDNGGMGPTTTQMPGNPANPDTVILAASIGGGILILLIVVIILLLYCLVYRKRALSRRAKPMKKIDKNASLTGVEMESRYVRQSRQAAPLQSANEGPKSLTASKTSASPPKRDRSFPRDALRLTGPELGRGSFAVVMKAEAHGIIRRGKVTIVAVKMLKDTASDSDRSDFLKELKVFKMLEPHPHVVTMLGHCTEKDPMYIVLEYLPNGNLQSHLQRVRTEGVMTSSPSEGSKLEPRQILSFAFQIAKGMEYLASKKCIHRDLATRNILLGEGLMCKVSDFGLARDVIDQRQYEMQSQGRVPVRWLALESLLQNVYTSKSDVWSFGIVVWELVTLGSHPYPGMSSSDVIKELKKGYRLPRPEHCSEEIYKFMTRCWQQNPDERPTFKEVVRCLDDMLTNAEGYLMMSDFREDNYEYLVPNVPSDQDSQ